MFSWKLDVSFWKLPFQIIKPSFILNIADAQAINYSFFIISLKTSDTVNLGKLSKLKRFLCGLLFSGNKRRNNKTRINQGINSDWPLKANQHKKHIFMGKWRFSRASIDWSLIIELLSAKCLPWMHEDIASKRRAYRLQAFIYDCNVFLREEKWIVIVLGNNWNV